jgi:hypothetical protein
MNNTETIILFGIILLALFVILPPLLRCDDSYMMNDSEGFALQQQQQQQQQNDAKVYMPSNVDNVKMNDPSDDMNGSLEARGNKKNYDTLIYDSDKKSIMTGSQFMMNEGIVAPPRIPPAWDPDAYGPKYNGNGLDPEDYENDPRMLYNKCSLSCCSAQYPTPFQGDLDPWVFDKNGNKKYMSSSYTCTNNTGGTGCLCMTQRQVESMKTGFVNPV